MEIFLNQFGQKWKAKKNIRTKDSLYPPVAFEECAISMTPVNAKKNNRMQKARELIRTTNN